MNETQKTVEQVITKAQLMQHLAKLGVGEGMILEVHSSLSSFGYVVGGAQTVVDALMELVGVNGTLIMALQCGDNSEPSHWQKPRIARHLFEEVRRTMPAYDKMNSETRGMGAVVENFRRREGVLFTEHPNAAFAAWGKYAKLLCNHQSLNFALAEESPCARLYELKASVLLLGCGLDSCTSLHLAEYRSDCRPIVLSGCAIMKEGVRTWQKTVDLDVDSTDFVKLETHLKEKKALIQDKIGNAVTTLFRLDAAVDEAVHYFEHHTLVQLYR